jgi:hypothetical protein
MRFILTITIILVGLAAGEAFATCDCSGDFAKPKTKFYQSRIVFVGKVLAIDDKEDQADVRFEVLRAYKGNLGETVTINTVAVGSMAAVCGTEFSVGGEYLIYGYGSGTSPEDVYMTEGCAMVKKLDCAQEDLKYLNGLAHIRGSGLDAAQWSLERDNSYMFKTTTGFKADRCAGSYGCE